MGPFTLFPEIEQSYFLIGVQCAASRRPGTSAVRVLVVDDEMRIADTTAEVLETAGFEVQTAYTGESALNVAATFRPDCLLSDVVMSGMNGVELALAFRRMMPEARIVLISGQMGNSDILDDAADRGLDFELLSKPIHPGKLISHLQKKPRD